MPSRRKSKSKSGSRRKGCRGGSTLKQLRKSAKACGLKGYSKMKKCALQRKLSGCTNVVWRKRSVSHQKKYKTRGKRGSMRHKHKISGKHYIFNDAGMPVLQKRRSASK
jgi:hypothetical protein